MHNFLDLGIKTTKSCHKEVLNRSYKSGTAIDYLESFSQNMIFLNMTALSDKHCPKIF